jgi:ferredoxin
LDIQLEPSKCIGSGQCVQAAPRVFDQDDDGTVVLVPGNHDGEADSVKRAIRVCPTRVISLGE